MADWLHFGISIQIIMILIIIIIITQNIKKRSTFQLNSGYNDVIYCLRFRFTPERTVNRLWMKIRSFLL